MLCDSVNIQIRHMARVFLHFKFISTKYLGIMGMISCALKWHSPKASLQQTWNPNGGTQKHMYAKECYYKTCFPFLFSILFNEVVSCLFYILVVSFFTMKILARLLTADSPWKLWNNQCLGLGLTGPFRHLRNTFLTFCLHVCLPSIMYVLSPSEEETAAKSIALEVLKNLVELCLCLFCL